jgi:hypothetical protein
MVDNNDALLREVEEELRREQWARLWDRYGTYVLGAAIALVAIVGGYKFWESRQIARSAAAGTEYNEAMKLAAEGKADEAARKLESLASTGPGGYAALAELQRAGTLIKARRPADAVAVLDKLATTSGTDSMLKNFAVIQAATLRLGEADFTEMQNRLKPLTENASPWRHSARELLGLAAYKAGRLEEARNSLAMMLGDAGTPQGALDRARVVLGSIAAAELAKSAATPSPTPTPAASEPAATPAPVPATPPASGASQP